MPRRCGILDVMIPLEEWMRQHDGIAHTASLRDAGYSRHTIRKAVAGGHLIRIRRLWLADARCTPERRAAAAIGGRVTCITAARTSGLWNASSDHLHVAVSSHASRFDRGEAIVHWSSGPIPVTARETEEPLFNVLFHVARCLEPVHALAVWESALRQRKVTPEELLRIRWGSAETERFASIAGALSDSGVETHFVWLMRTIGVVVRQQVWIEGHRVDALIGERLIVQIDGFEHHSLARDRRRDIHADARLVLRGYTVLRFDYQQVLFDHDHVTQTVRIAIAQGLHLGR